MSDIYHYSSPRVSASYWLQMDRLFRGVFLSGSSLWCSTSLLRSAGDLLSHFFQCNRRIAFVRELVGIRRDVGRTCCGSPKVCSILEEGRGGQDSQTSCSKTSKLQNFKLQTLGLASLVQPHIPFPGRYCTMLSNR